MSRRLLVSLLVATLLLLLWQALVTLADLAERSRETMKASHVSSGNSGGIS